MEISVNVTVPKELLRMSDVQDSIARFMTQKTAPEVKALFRKTIYGWKAQNKPRFRQKLYRSMSKMSETIWADDNAEVYQMVNFGTPPHVISVRGYGRLLKFKWGGPGSYKPATRPGVIQSKRAYKTGPVVQTLAVRHPGIEEPRRFDIAIKEEYEPTFRADMQDAISVAAAKTAQSNN